jgi:hypothetical protein
MKTLSLAGIISMVILFLVVAKVVLVVDKNEVSPYV